MDSSEIMIEFFNGELDPAVESDFFYSLSVSDDFRSKFKQMLSIEKAIGSRLEVSAPSPALSGKIFSDLGFTYYAGEAPTLEAAKPGFFTRFKGMIITGVLSSLFTAVMVAGIFSTINNNKSEHRDTSPILTQAKAGIHTESSSALNSPAENRNQSLINERDTRPFVFSNENNSASHSNSIEKEPSSDSRDIYVNEPGPNIYKTIIPIDIQTEYGPRTSRDQSIAFVPIIKEDINETQQDIISGDTKFSLEIRSSENWMLPASTLPKPSYTPRFLNKGISLLYKLPDDYIIDRVGLDLRQEDFFMSYKHSDSETQNFIYEQQLNFISYGILLQKDIYRLGAFQSFGQLYLGGNYYGLIGRALGGLIYSPTGDLSFVAGFEYGNMLYFHQGNAFSSSKFSLNYGLLLRF